MSDYYYPAVVTLFVCQLLLSGTLSARITYHEHRSDIQPRRVVGAVLWQVCDWLKSGLIAVSIIYGPEKHHWEVRYGLCAAVVFLGRDLGLFLVQRNNIKSRPTVTPDPPAPEETRHD